MHRSLYALLVLLTASLAFADDYPQWMGPERNGVSKEKGLLKEWPKGGPKLKWKLTNLGGESYSAPAIAKGRIYLLCDFDKEEHVVALDEKDGNKVWSKKIGAVGKNMGPQYPGPRSTPTVDGDFLYALGSDGDLVCLSVAKGDTVWHKNLAQDFEGKQGLWAYSESPLVDGELVIVSPGGTAATVVALKKKDGSLAWKAPIAGGETAGYGSPIKIDVGGVKQYVVFLSNGLAGLSAADGKVLWRFEPPAKNSMANIPTPMFHNNLVFASTGQGKGGVAKLTASNGSVTAEQVWLTAETAASLGGYIRVGDHLYGVGGPRNDQQLMCVEMATGKIVWKDKSVGPASLCVADGMLYVRGHEGEVALVEATPAGYKEHGRFEQPDRSKKPAWPYPVVANGCLYLRDVNVLLCYDVRDGKK